MNVIEHAPRYKTADRGARAFLPGNNRERSRAKIAKNAKIVGMGEDDLAKIIVQTALDLHREIGPGLLESVYEVLFADMLREQGLDVERQKPIPIRFRGVSFDEGFRADLVVGKLVLVELKSITALAPVHRKQVLTYLRLSNFKLGLLINFGGELLKGNIERLVNKLQERSS